RGERKIGLSRRQVHESRGDGGDGATPAPPAPRAEPAGLKGGLGGGPLFRLGGGPDPDPSGRDGGPGGRGWPGPGPESRRARGRGMSGANGTTPSVVRDGGVAMRPTPPTAGTGTSHREQRR